MFSLMGVTTKMPILSAKFSLRASPPCLLSLKEGKVDLSFDFEVKEFKVKATLISEKHWSVKKKDDTNVIMALDQIELIISREEQDSPPELTTSPDGIEDLAPRGEYFKEKLPIYKGVALEITNNILHFFQYALFTPLVRPFPSWDYNLNNPAWFNKDGEEIRGGHYITILPPIPGLHGNLNVQRLNQNAMLLDLLEYLKHPPEISLADSLLSDAQSAWYENNLRRSVIELAICAEILVKRKFFAKSSPSGAAFDYLEDKSKVSVKVLELLSAVAKEAFSRSYKDEEPDSFKDIDHLFRCRNKIAHRGELSFKDNGTTIIVDKTLSERWWNSVLSLKKWLDSIP